MSSGNTKNGRSNPSGRYVNTVAKESAEQAMLVNQDAIVDRINSIVSTLAGAADFPTAQTALTALSPLTKVTLIDV